MEIRAFVILENDKDNVGPCRRKSLHRAMRDSAFALVLAHSVGKYTYRPHPRLTTIPCPMFFSNCYQPFQFDIRLKIYKQLTLKRKIMKSSIKPFLLFLALSVVSSFISCEDISIVDKDESLDFHKVVYSPGHCCLNMNLIEADNFPDTCGGPYILYAFNLEEFNEVDYSVGDTLIIQFNFTDECLSLIHI